MKKNKTIFISGSSSGIGYYLAKEYMQLGYSVIINGKNLKKLKFAIGKFNNQEKWFG